MRIKPEDRAWMLSYCERDLRNSRDFAWYRKLYIRLLWIAMWWAPFGIRIIYDEGMPYLILGHWTTTRWFVPRLYLHYFVKSDQDHDVHNHPMNGLSIILTGGYREHRMIDPNTYTSTRDLPGVWTEHKDHKPFRPFTITRDTFHRVELTHGRCWTLFITGKRVGPSDGTDWGFINLATGKYTPWGEYKMDPQNKRPGVEEVQT